MKSQAGKRSQKLHQLIPQMASDFRSVSLTTIPRARTKHNPPDQQLPSNHSIQMMGNFFSHPLILTQTPSAFENKFTSGQSTYYSTKYLSAEGTATDFFKKIDEEKSFKEQLQDYLRLCNREYVDKLGVGLRRLRKFSKPSSEHQQIQSPLPSPHIEVDAFSRVISKTRNQLLSDLRHFNIKLPTKNFTLRHLDVQENAPNLDQSNQNLRARQAASNRNVLTLQKRLKQSRLDTPYRRTPQRKLSEGAITLQTESKDDTNYQHINFENYVKHQPIRRQDMVYNIKHLERLQEKREKDYISKLQRPDQQSEIIKKKNLIAVLSLNSKKIEVMKKISGEVLEQITDHGQKAELLLDKVIKYVSV